SPSKRLESSHKEGKVTQEDTGLIVNPQQAVESVPKVARAVRLYREMAESEQTHRLAGDVLRETWVRACGRAAIAMKEELSGCGNAEAGARISARAMDDPDYKAAMIRCQETSGAHLLKAAEVNAAKIDGTIYDLE
ncbi:MAG: hypothetical protein V2A73_07930, partial [Pseudomonadota bacterium]